MPLIDYFDKVCIAIGEDFPNMDINIVPGCYDFFFFFSKTMVKVSFFYYSVFILTLTLLSVPIYVCFTVIASLVWRH